MSNVERQPTHFAKTANLQRMVQSNSLLPHACYKIQKYLLFCEHVHKGKTVLIKYDFPRQGTVVGPMTWVKNLSVISSFGV